MRSLIFILMMCIGQLAHAQKFNFPELTKQAKNIGQIVPKHWKAIDTVIGDLNSDHKPDLVLVLEYDYPVAEVRAYGSIDTEIIKETQKPRIMAIYFKQTNDQFKFALQNNSFILRDKEGGIFDDPYDGIRIAENTLNLRFKGGNNWRWRLDYQFKFDHQNWVLIHAKNLYYHNSSGDMEERNYNFLTKKVRATTGNLNYEATAKVVVNNLTVAQLRTFDTFTKPWTWEITKDNFL